MNTYDGWYLLDHHRNRTKTSGPAGAADTRPWYTTRQTCQHGYRRPHLIVIHTPETLEDFTAPYDEAERIAEYGSNTTRASWHDTVDGDSIVPMLPPGYTAWHVRGFNRCGIGMEIGAKATSWNRAPQAWVDGVIRNAAWRAAQHAATFDIPAIPLFTPGRRYSSPVSAAGVGFVAHHPLDPTRRTDPGFDFPWDRFLKQVDAYLEGDDDDMAIKEGDSGRTVRAVKKCYNGWHRQIGEGRLVDETDDGYGPAMADLIRQFQTWSNLPATGQVDGVTFAALTRWEERPAVQGPPGPPGPQGPPGPVGDVSLPHRETVEIVRG